MQQPGFVPPADLDGKGIFVKEIEEALAEGRIDLAVHSLKDLPTKLSPRFTLAAIPKRADARDAWVCEPYWALHTLPMGGRIGTTSPRRKAQILALRPDVEESYRGWVDEVADLARACPEPPADERATAARLCALVDGLAQQALLGGIGRARARALVRQAIAGELRA